MSVYFQEAISTAARMRQERLTKPKGALGQLERVAIQMAGIQAEEQPEARPAYCLLFASDHPVCRHGVSAYPQEVTAAMLENFVRGGAAASVMCSQLDIPLMVHDVGVKTSVYHKMTNNNTMYGELHRHACAQMPVGDLRTEDAMDPEVFRAAWTAGCNAVHSLRPNPKVLLLGEMGIGNTTVASVVAGGLLGLCAKDVVGQGTGLDDEGMQRKFAVVQDALMRLEGESQPFEVLRKAGGRELVAMAAAAETALEARCAVLVDGFIVSTAVLALCTKRPELSDGLIFAHQSREPAHRAVISRLQSMQTQNEPSGILLDLQMALGEGSGALAAFPLVEMACATHRCMATFAEAEVPGRLETLP
ncbi:MAG: nicotinate-nucleotide--dimethylbenzimidazole phosphoribosyltransferase [Myxococcota bacterium]